MEHGDFDAMTPHSPCTRSMASSRHIDKDTEDTRGQDEMQRGRDMANGVSTPRRQLSHDGMDEIISTVSGRHMQQQSEKELDRGPPAVVVSRNAISAFPHQSSSSLVSFITPSSSSQMIPGSIPSESVVLSTQLVGQRGPHRHVRPLNKVSSLGNEQVYSHEDRSPSHYTMASYSSGGAGVSQEVDNLAELGNTPCPTPFGRRFTQLEPPLPQVTLNSRLASARSTPADGTGTSSGSQETRASSKWSTASRHCYVPGRASRLHSGTSVSDGGGGPFIALLSTTSRATTQASQPTTRGPNESLHGLDTSDTRASLLSLTSETVSTSEWTTLTPVRHRDEYVMHRTSLPPPPSMRTRTFIHARAMAPTLLAPGMYTSTRLMPSALMVSTSLAVEPQHLEPYFITRNPLTKQQRLSDKDLGGHATASFQFYDGDTPGTAVTPRAHYADRRSPLLRGCAGTGRGESRTPPIAVLVPLAPEPAAPASASPLPMQQLEGETYEVNASSLSSERSWCYEELPSPRPHRQEPAPAPESRASVCVSPLHPSLSHVFLPSPELPLSRSTPAHSSPPCNDDPTLLEYVAGLKPPRGSCSIRGGLLCVGGTLCVMPLCAVVLLFSLHYWAVTLQESSYATVVLRPHVGGMTAESALVLGILLAFLVMGGGGGVILYAVLYRLAIRCHLRAFALCVRLADAPSPLDIHHLAVEDSGGRCDSAMPIDAAAAAVQKSANDSTHVSSFSPFAVRWHEEVSRLVNNLTCAIEVNQAEWRSFLASERRSLVMPHEDANWISDCPVVATTPTDGPFCSSNNSRSLPCGVQPSAPTAEKESWSLCGTQRGSRYRMSEAVFSRRPQHPVDVSKRQESVTVVVCRLMVPTELLVQQSPLTRAQLEELQRLSNEFHQRLRAVPRTSYAAITEVSVSEVVFSFNTVSPLPSLVASPAAVALAVAASKALVEWRPTYLGTSVRWGIAVHRFDAYTCPTRGTQGRLYVSFGTVEYDFARLLAELAALFDYGALCHAGFLADASCESQSLPVDYVMDLRQQAFLVYQLHDGDVDRKQRAQMNRAIAAMRNGEYKAAADALEAWSRKSGSCGIFARAAAHLRYVAGFLERAARQRRPHVLEGKVASESSPSFLLSIEGVAEWAAESLLTSYFRPPPVWEEEEEAPIAPRMSNPDRLRAPFILSTSGGGGGCSSGTGESCRSNVAVLPPALPRDCSAGELATFLQALMHRSSPARIPYESPTPQREGPTGPRAIQESLHRPCEVAIALEADAGPLNSLPRNDEPLSSATQSVCRGGNVLESGSAPLSLRDNAAGCSSLSPATRCVFEMSTPTTALPDMSNGDQMWAALASPTEPDLGSVTMTAQRPHLFSNSWSLAESGVPEMLTLTPLTSGVLLPSQSDVCRQRQASVLLPAPKNEEAAAAAVACMSAMGSTAARSSRGRCDSGGNKSHQTHGRNGFQPVTEVPASDEWSPRPLGQHASSQSIDTTIARLTSDASHESVLARSGSARRRASVSTAAVSSVLPLFSGSTVPFSVQEKIEARSEVDISSEVDPNQELSMMSVAQHSRSRLSQRATAQPSSVVCSCTRRIDRSLSDKVMVFQGFHPDGYLVAVKRADRRAEKQVSLLRHEVDLLREVHHRNVVNIVSAWKDDNAEYFAMEYACETLATVLQKFKVLLPGVVRFYARELLNALVYLHRDCGIIHRDLSPNNVIITNTTDRSRVKLIDFGRSVMTPHLRSGSGGLSVAVPSSASLELAESHSSRSKSSGTDVTLSVAGTPLFMSPQACQGLLHPTSDIWSLGIIVHLCLTGTYPYPPETFTDPETFIANVGSGKLTPVLVDTCEMTGEARDFIEQCLTLSHTSRSSAVALLKHSFVER
ncbi:protein kinase, putative [Leishmania panamensis]|uniref:Protein kinase, putative n=1 Tax=Leishmania panamensis TaxID=5679 RepID=A0A088S0J7_LEIPA|nr:protein kinase, putative [Leishmania panamensis]AIO01928.1 protein kinase, putative [Leishmania panamensis]